MTRVSSLVLPDIGLALRNQETEKLAVFHDSLNL